MKLSSNQTSHLGRVFPDRQFSSEERAKRKAESHAFAERCRAIFYRVKPELIDDHYDWFMVIEPDSGDYFIDPDKAIAKQKAREKHPDAMFLIKRLNESGCCGKI